ncbi:MAG: hypothetical protein IRY99_00700 [Isosphaeraceae bacterium]|nr:hypothetical protein [Isosphaeraceae bacterium]
MSLKSGTRGALFLSLSLLALLPVAGCTTSSGDGSPTTSSGATAKGISGGGRDTLGAPGGIGTRNTGGASAAGGTGTTSR